MTPNNETLAALFATNPEWLARIDDGRIVLHLTDEQFAVLGSALATSGQAASVVPEGRYSGWLWTHTKSGGTYSLLGNARLQTDQPLADMAEVYVYQGEDHRMWVRPVQEFNDRFKRVRTTQPASAPVREGDAFTPELVEERLNSWRQRQMNRSGDRLALDDFMGQDSIDDLIDFVCAPATPAAPAKPREAQEQAPTDLQILEVAANPMTSPCNPWWLKEEVTCGDVRAAALVFARAVLALSIPPAPREPSIEMLRQAWIDSLCSTTEYTIGQAKRLVDEQLASLADPASGPVAPSIAPDAREIVEQLIACHEEQSCPAVELAKEWLAAPASAGVEEFPLPEPVAWRGLTQSYPYPQDNDWRYGPWVYDLDPAKYKPLYTAEQVRHVLRHFVSMPPESQAARDVLAERQRQISAEGWTPEHDDEHDEGEMAYAAAGYAAAVSDHLQAVKHEFDGPGGPTADDAVTQPPLNPWPHGWDFKPAPARRMLVKAGALILAEIERLDRSASLDLQARTAGKV